MAGHMVHLNDQVKAKCVWDWYIKTPSQTQAQIFASMQKYPDHSPTTTLIALMRHACGKPLIK